MGSKHSVNGPGSTLSSVRGRKKTKKKFGAGRRVAPSKGFTATKRIGSVSECKSKLYENIFAEQKWKVVEQRHTKFVKGGTFAGEFVNSVYLIQKGKKAVVVRVYRAPGSGQTKMYAGGKPEGVNSSNITAALKQPITQTLDDARTRYAKVAD